MLKIVFFGDSICNGQGVSVHRGWVARLSQSIEELSPESTVINASVNGCTTRQALERMSYDVISNHPDYVIVQFGLNDANQWNENDDIGGFYPRVSIDAYEANLAEICDRAVLNGCFVMLMTCHIPSIRKSGPEYCDDVRAYNERVRLVGAEKGVTLIDIAHAQVESITQDDGVHLNDVGHQVYFETVASRLMPIVRGSTLKRFA